MKIDISKLFEENDNDAGTATLAEEFERPTTCVGTCVDGDIIVWFYLSNKFNTDNYSYVGLSDEPIDESGEASGYKILGVRAVDGYATNDYGVIYDEAGFFNSGFTRYDEGMWTLYPAAEAKNGKAYPVGKKIAFRFSTPFLRQVAATSNSVKVEILGLEQAVSPENYASIGVSRSLYECGVGGVSEMKHMNGWAEAPITYRSSMLNSSITLYNMPSGSSYDLYFYKKTPTGRFFNLGEVTVTTEESEIPLCSLDVKFVIKEFENGLVCKNYPVIPVEAYENFIKDINTVRVFAGMTEYKFEAPLPQSAMRAELFGQLCDAITELYDHLGFATSLVKPSGNFEMTKEFFDGLSESLRYIAEQIYQRKD